MFITNIDLYANSPNKKQTVNVRILSMYEIIIMFIASKVDFVRDLMSVD